MKPSAVSFGSDLDQPVTQLKGIIRLKRVGAFEDAAIAAAKKPSVNRQGPYRTVLQRPSLPATVSSRQKPQTQQKVVAVTRAQSRGVAGGVRYVHMKSAVPDSMGRVALPYASKD